MKQIRLAFLFFAVLCVGAAAFAQDMITAPDIITLRDGEVIEALVKEVGEVEVRYKNFDNPNGPFHTLKRWEIFKIKYGNGSEEVFKDDESAFTPEPAPVISPMGQAGVQPPVGMSLEPLSNQGGKIYNRDGRELSKEEVRSLMANASDPNLLARYDTGNILRATGWCFWGVTAGCFVMGVVKLVGSATNDDKELRTASLYWGIGAVGFMAPSIACFSVGTNKVKKSVDGYNESINQQQTSNASMKFGVTPSGGIGLTLNF